MNPQTQLFPWDYIVVDLETATMAPGKVDPHTDRIIEIGYCIVKSSQIVEAKSFLVNPGFTIQPWTTEFLGITPEMVAELPADGSAINRVLQMLDVDKGWIAGFNIMTYDHTVLASEGRRYSEMGHPLHGGGMLNPARIFDVGALYKAYRMALNKNPKAPREDGEQLLHYMKRILETRHRGSWNLAQAALEFGLATGDVNRHRAKGDCILTHRLLEHMRGMREKS